MAAEPTHCPGCHGHEVVKEKGEAYPLCCLPISFGPHCPGVPVADGMREALAQSVLDAVEAWVDSPDNGLCEKCHGRCEVIDPETERREHDIIRAFNAYRAALATPEPKGDA